MRQANSLGINTLRAIAEEEERKEEYLHKRKKEDKSGSTCSGISRANYFVSLKTLHTLLRPGSPLATQTDRGPMMKIANSSEQAFQLGPAFYCKFVL